MFNMLLAVQEEHNVKSGVKILTKLKCRCIVKVKYSDSFVLVHMRTFFPKQ